MPLALMTFTGGLAREVLEEAGWDTLDGDHPHRGSGANARAIDLWIFGIAADRFAERVQMLAALKIQAPNLRMVVIAPFLRDSAGHCLSDILLDVPVIRSGFERELLLDAVAAAIL